MVEKEWEERKVDEEDDDCLLRFLVSERKRA